MKEEEGMVNLTVLLPYIKSNSLISAIYSILRLILLYYLVILHSKRLKTL